MRDLVCNVIFLSSCLSQECTPYGYSLDEVQIASDFVRQRLTRKDTPLKFLDTDWAAKTRYVGMG